jgi:hypothetical protein
MARKILRLMEAKPILESIHDDLVQVIRYGFNDWLKIREFAATFDGGPLNYKPRTKAGIIHDHIEKFLGRSSPTANSSGSMTSTASSAWWYRINCLSGLRKWIAPIR